MYGTVRSRSSLAALPKPRQWMLKDPFYMSLPTSRPSRPWGASALFTSLEALSRTAPYGACNFFDETGPNFSCPLCRVLSVCGAVSPCVCVV